MNDGRLELATAPGAEPLSTADAKTHLRVDHSDDDSYIDALVKSARRYIEDIQNRSFIDTTWNYWLDDWPEDRRIVLPRAPLSSVTSVSHFDDDDTETTVATSDYEVDDVTEPGAVVLSDDAQWPTTDLRATKAIKVVFVAGYGAAASDVPEDALHLVRLLVSHWYEHREPEVVGTTSKSLPAALKSLLWKDRLVLRT